MPENRDQSRQKRSKENRASREAVQARKAAVAKKTEPVEEAPKGKRKTRAQAAPVRGSGATSVAAATTSTASASKASTPRPAPVEVDPNAPWIRRVISVPGGRAVLISFAVAIAGTIFILAVSGPQPLERWNSKLEGQEVVSCIDTDRNEIELDGRSAESVCGYAPDASEKYKDSDNRTLAEIDARILEVYGPGVFAVLAVPLLASGVAFALSARPNRRRIFAYCALAFALWMFLLGLQVGIGIYFIPSFGALVFAWWQARKADPPIRPERPAGGGLFGGASGGGGLFGGGGGGLFGGRRRSTGDEDVIDAEIVDEGGPKDKP